jgi:hypothetical protein
LSPEEAAVALREEIEEGLADLGAEVRACAVEAPSDLGADLCFRIRLEMGEGLMECELPAGLAMAYLADEEAAVDEFKRWLRNTATV